MQALLVATRQFLPAPGDFLLGRRIAAPHGQHNADGDEQEACPEIEGDRLIEQQPAEQHADKQRDPGGEQGEQNFLIGPLARFDLLLDLVARQLLLTQREGDIFKHVQVWEEGIALKDGVDVALVRRNVVDALSEEENVPLIGRFKAADHAQGRGLAAAGGAEQREEFVVVDVEVDVVENGFAVKLFGDAPELNDFFHG